MLQIGSLVVRSVFCGGKLGTYFMSDPAQVPLFDDRSNEVRLSPRKLAQPLISLQ